MESYLLVDRQITTRRLTTTTTSKNFNSENNTCKTPIFSPATQSLTFEQRQNLLFLLQNQVGGGGNNSSGGSGFFGPSPPTVPSFFPSSTTRLNNNIPPLPTHLSLPPIQQYFPFQSTEPASRSPPLLPLPAAFSRSQSLPITFTSPPSMPNRKGGGNNNIQRKTKQSSGSRRKPICKVDVITNNNNNNPPPPRPVPPVKAVEVCEEKEAGEIVDDELGEVFYSLSPPPSSLPLPTFTLRPPRNSVVCHGEALGLCTN